MCWVRERGRLQADRSKSMTGTHVVAANHPFCRGDMAWHTLVVSLVTCAQAIVGPILQQYTESTDGANVEAKESAFVWHYGAADPDFGSLQACSAHPLPQLPTACAQES